MPDFQAGQEINGYRLEAVVGTGGQGEVWRAREVASNNLVAIKLLQNAAPYGSVGRMRHEVEIIAAAVANRSRHVVRVIEGGDEPVPFVVMEYVEGTDLDSMLRRHGGDVRPLPQDQVIRIGVAVTDALMALHKEGIVHRDLKPKNVMIDIWGEIKVLDFGIAKVLGFHNVTVTNQHPLSTPYAAPEVWSGEPVAASDVYALGVTLFELLSGEPPFSGNIPVMYQKHLSQAPDLTRLPDDCVAPLSALVQSCLSKAPEERPSAGECFEMLKQAQADLEANRNAAVREKRPPERFNAWLLQRPHTGIPWAWHCRHRETGDEAVVELHFTDDLASLGTQLQRAQKAVANNAAFAALGAERLLDAERFILSPSETFGEETLGQFCYFVARQESDPSALTPEVLARAVNTLRGLLDAADAIGLELNFSADELSLQPGGAVHLRHPGIWGKPRVDAEADALSVLRAQKLSSDLQQLVEAATNLQDLSARLPPVAELPASRPAATPSKPAGAVNDEELERTVLASRAERAAQIPASTPPPASRPSTPVQPPSPPAVSPQPVRAAASLGTPIVQMHIRNVTNDSRAQLREYLLTINNRSDRVVSLKLSVADDYNQLEFSMPERKTLFAKASDSVYFTAKAREAKGFDRTRARQFTVTAQDTESAEPPVYLRGDY